jgi:hypothetical protein
MASRNVKPMPRGKPSGLPFHARFTDVAREAGLREPVIYGGVDHKTYILETVGCGAAFIDYDNDGWLDIFLPSGTRFEGAANATNRLYRNNRDGTFTDVTGKAGLHRTGWASGVAVGDYNNDGFDDLFLSGWGQNALYRNNGNGTFTDVTAEAGLLHEKVRWGSGCTFIDYDRNGLLDLFVGTYLEFDPKSVPPAGGDGNCNWKGIPVHCGPRGLPPGTASLYRNNGDGTFTDVTGASGVGKAKGSYMLTAAAADFDNDGDIDLAISCNRGPLILLRADGAEGRNWIKVSLQGRKSNRQGIGSMVRVFVGGVIYVQSVGSQGSYLSQHATPLHFGLGSATSVDRIEVVWPSGRRQTVDHPRIRQHLHLRED